MRKLRVAKRLARSSWPISSLSCHLQQTIAQYQDGLESAFRPLWVSQAGIRKRAELLPWPLIAQAEVGPTWVILRKEGESADWFRRPIERIPNAALLKALLEYQRTMERPG